MVDTPQDMETLRAAAELHMLERLGVPPGLLPSALEGHLLRHLSEALRRAALRRMRLANRLAVAAGTLAGQAHLVIEGVSVGRSQDDRPPVTPADAARITELYAQLGELDRRLADEAATLVTVWRAYCLEHGTVGVAWAAILPDASERAVQRGLGQ